MYGNSYSTGGSFNDSMPVMEPSSQQVVKMRESVNNVASFVSSQLTDEFTVTGQLIDDVQGCKIRILIMGPMGHVTFDVTATQDMFDDEETNPIPDSEVAVFGGQIVASMVQALQSQQPDDVSHPAS